MNEPSKESLEQSLLRLATSAKGRSEAARLRDVLPAVEQALAAGVSRAAILAELHEQGFRMAMQTFAKTLYRLRRERDNPEGRRRRQRAIAGSGLRPAAPQPSSSAPASTGGGRDERIGAPAKAPKFEPVTGDTPSPAHSKW